MLMLLPVVLLTLVLVMLLLLLLLLLQLELLLLLLDVDAGRLYFDRSPRMCVPLAIKTYLPNCNGGSDTFVSRRTLTRSACTWKLARAGPFPQRS